MHHIENATEARQLARQHRSPAPRKRVDMLLTPGSREIILNAWTPPAVAVFLLNIATG
jgi:hypothetical protein